MDESVDRCINLISIIVISATDTQINVYLVYSFHKIYNEVIIWRGNSSAVE